MNRSLESHSINVLPDDIRVGNAREDAGFTRSISLVQYFMTNHDMDLTGFGHAGS